MCEKSEMLRKTSRKQDVAPSDNSGNVNFKRVAAPCHHGDIIPFFVDIAQGVN